MNALTTLKLTSASSSAIRISRSAVSTDCSVETGVAADLAEDVLEAIAEGFEHDRLAGRHAPCGAPGHGANGYPSSA
jgi:hypothetical protein